MVKEYNINHILKLHHSQKGASVFPLSYRISPLPEAWHETRLPFWASNAPIAGIGRKGWPERSWQTKKSNIPDKFPVFQKKNVILQTAS